MPHAAKHVPSIKGADRWVVPIAAVELWRRGRESPWHLVGAVALLEARRPEGRSWQAQRATSWRRLTRRSGQTRAAHVLAQPTPCEAVQHPHQTSSPAYSRLDADASRREAGEGVRRTPSDPQEGRCRGTGPAPHPGRRLRPLHPPGLVKPHRGGRPMPPVVRRRWTACAVQASMGQATR